MRIESDYPSFGTNGKGRSKAYALASAYAEYIERLQNELLFLGTPNRRFILQSIKNTCGKILFPDEKKLQKEDILSLPEYVLSELFNCQNDEISHLVSAYCNRQAVNNNDIIGVPFIHLDSGKTYDIPIRLMFSLIGSTGMAAGNTYAEAVYQAMCEIIERYAAATIYYNELTPPSVPDSILACYPQEYAIIKSIEEQGIRLDIKDFTCGKDLPAIGIIAYSRNGRSYRLNVGCDTSFQIALSRCLTEIQQGCDSLVDWESYFLPIPTEEFSYFKNNDKDSEHERINQFERFAVDSSGVFPLSLFKNVWSYELKTSAFKTHDNYESEVEYLKEVFHHLGSEIYVRDVSFTGFPSVYVYVSNNISCVARKNIDLSINEQDYSSNPLFIKIDKWFEGQNLHSKAGFESYVKELYPSITSLKLRSLTVANVLRLKFSPDYYLSHLPICYLLFLSTYCQKEFTSALTYLTETIIQLELADNPYFCEMKKHVQWRMEIADGIYSARMEKILSSENNFSELELPSCPHCDDCKIPICLSRINARFQAEYIIRL